MKQTILAAGRRYEIVCIVTQANKHSTPFFEIPVHLPEGVTRLDVSFEYSKTKECVLDIGILDSSATKFPTRTGFRGWSGGARNSFFIASDSATPGYVAGPMPAGVWTLLLGLYKVPTEGVRVTLFLQVDSTPRSVIAMEKPATPRRDKAGWYRGDLHCHTYHSDAKGAPEVLAENARNLGLDFLAVTDHNTTTQWQYFAQHSTADLVFIPGMEITTYRGHANIFGLTEWIDFRLGASDDLDALVAETHRQGALLSVNHDKEPLLWKYEYPAMDCMEVFHGHWLTGNDGILDRYDRFLADGRRISLIGGSDYHQPEQLQAPGPFGLGKPTTVIWLPHLDSGAVIDGLRLGYGYVTESPNGPHLAFTANGQPMGSVVQAQETVEIEVTVKGAAGDRIVWVSEKGPILDCIIPTQCWQQTLVLATPEKFLRAEIVAEISRERLIKELLDWYEGKTELHRAQQSLNTPPPIRRTLSNPVYF